MTLLVGVRCGTDAVVLAADSAATYGGISGMTIRQNTKKIAITSSGAAIATSGPVGLGQLLVGELSQRELISALEPMEPWQAMALLRAKFGTHFIRELKYAAEAASAIGQSAALLSALSFTLLAIRIKDIPCLFQFNQQGAPELSEDLPWVTCGSGQQSADAFVAFLRRIFWNERQPTLQEGVFTALWTVQQAIATAHGGIGGNPQVVVLGKDGPARELSEGELQEHLQSIEAAENALANYRTVLSPSEGTEPLPQP